MAEPGLAQVESVLQDLTVRPVLRFVLDMPLLKVTPTCIGVVTSPVGTLVWLLAGTTLVTFITTVPEAWAVWNFEVKFDVSVAPAVDATVVSTVIRYQVLVFSTAAGCQRIEEPLTCG